jgi:hypothetical protein
VCRDGAMRGGLHARLLEIVHTHASACNACPVRSCPVACHDATYRSAVVVPCRRQAIQYATHLDVVRVGDRQHHVSNLQRLPCSADGDRQERWREGGEARAPQEEQGDGCGRAGADLARLKARGGRMDGWEILAI